MARAIWKGRIQFETVDVPVKLYTAVGDIAVHSHLLHDQDYSRLQQRMVCPEDNVVVPPEETVKGYEIATGEYVVIESDELDFAEPQASRQIEVMEFVEAHEIDDRFLDRTYYLGPDGDEQGYVDLLQSLKETGAAGMCKWVMRRRAYVGVLAAAGDVLTLTMHRYAGEIVPEDAFELEDVDISEKEMQIAERLIHELAETFEPQKYRMSIRSIAEADRAEGAGAPRQRTRLWRRQRLRRMTGCWLRWRRASNRWAEKEVDAGAFDTTR